MSGREDNEMTSVAEEFTETAVGFEGAVAGLTLPDVIQMNALNRFSGCITVQFGQRTGMIFLRDGEIIHAEQGEKGGEDAFYEILQWPGGKFNLQPKVTTTSLTIRESWKFLLMEACRLLDENRHRSRILHQPLEKKTAGTTGGNDMSTQVTGRLLQIPGVSHAVVLHKDGTPVNDASYEAENLAAQAVYLAMIGNQLGGIFEAGELRAAAVEGKASHLLLYESRSHFLGVAIRGECQRGAVEAEIRKALAPKN
jgi:predicted regulator of Ras-like GTPase activity (Roadblock/LC7/MglB family)